jgi:hypothetical protein
VPIAADDARRTTAGERRENIIASLSRELDKKNPTSAACGLDALIADASHPRPMLVSGDIDGLVSAAMLRQAAPAWDAVALIVKSGTVYLHPDVVDNLDLSACFGVDVYSTYIDNVSNHVALWGDKRPAGSTDAAAAARAYDEEVRRRAEATLLASPSLWAGIQGSYADEPQRPRAASYRYPLGTAHILLAMLEAVDRSPKMFDREYLPWLVANCDGGLKTIRDYPYNVPMWWSCLAAAVGPASLSEQVYQVAATQRPTEFVDTVNRLRAEGSHAKGTPAAHLDDNWNLRTQSLGDITPVVRWISSLSGWPDPFRGGAEGLSAWTAVPLTTAGKLLTSGLPQGGDTADRVERFKAHLRASLGAVHTNFAYFDQSQRLGWVAPWDTAVAPDRGDLPDALQPDTGLFEQEQAVADAKASSVII